MPVFFSDIVKPSPANSIPNFPPISLTPLTVRSHACCSDRVVTRYSSRLGRANPGRYERLVQKQALGMLP
jgi:hypothetical protein